MSCLLARYGLYTCKNSTVSTWDTSLTTQSPHLHFLVESIVQNEGMGKGESMGLHRMALSCEGEGVPSEMASLINWTCRSGNFRHQGHKSKRFSSWKSLRYLEHVPESMTSIYMATPLSTYMAIPP